MDLDSTGLALGASAAAFSVLALAGSAYAMLSSRGSRMATLERQVGNAVAALQGRVEQAETTVRLAADEAQELFDRAESVRRRVAAQRSRLDRNTEPEAPPTPVTRADVLRDVERRLNGR